MLSKAEAAPVEMFHPRWDTAQYRASAVSSYVESVPGKTTFK